MPCVPSLTVYHAQAEKLEGARGHFDGAWAHFQEALDKLPEEDRGKKLKPVQVPAHEASTLAPAACGKPDSMVDCF